MIRHAGQFARECSKPDRAFGNRDARQRFDRQAISDLRKESSSETQPSDIGQRAMPRKGLDFLLEAPVSDSDFDLEVADSLVVE